MDIPGPEESSPKCACTAWGDSRCLGAFCPLVPVSEFKTCSPTRSLSATLSSKLTRGARGQPWNLPICLLGGVSHQNMGALQRKWFSVPSLAPLCHDAELKEALAVPTTWGHGHRVSSSAPPPPSPISPRTPGGVIRAHPLMLVFYACYSANCFPLFR